MCKAFATAALTAAFCAAPAGASFADTETPAPSMTQQSQTQQEPQTDRTGWWGLLGLLGLGGLLKKPKREVVQAPASSATATRAHTRTPRTAPARRAPRERPACPAPTARRVTDPQHGRGLTGLPVGPRPSSSGGAGTTRTASCASA